MLETWSLTRTTGTLLFGTLTLALALAGGANAATVPTAPLNDETTPRLTIEVLPAWIEEGKVSVISGALDWPLAEDLKVALRFSGDAGPRDFRVDEPALFFAAGATSAKTQLVAVADDDLEKSEQLVVWTDEPAVVLANRALLHITDAPVLGGRGRTAGVRQDVACFAAPLVWLEASSKAIAEGSGAERLTLRLSGPACQDLSFPVEIERIPVPQDVVLSAWSFEVPAGALSSEITIQALDDAEDEAAETVTVRVQPVWGNDTDISVALELRDNDADVVLENLSGPEQVVAGVRAQFRIVVTNPGFKELTGVAVTESPVDGLTDVEWICVGKGGAECPVKGEGFAQLTASMPAGSSIVVLVDALVEASRREALIHSASVAVVDGQVSDPDPADNIGLATHLVDVVADLALDLDVGPWNPKGEDPKLTYHLVVRNLGPSDATGAELTSPLRDSLAWVGGDPDCVAVDSTVTCNVGGLAAGAARKLDMVLSVPAPYPAYTLQEAWLDAADTDPFPENNEAALETKLDVFSPVLVEVVALGAALDEPLAACSQLEESPARLKLRFSEALVAGGRPGDVDSPRSYRLFRPGANGDFEVASCAAFGPAEGVTDDVEIPLLGARWDAKTATVELDLPVSLTAPFVGIHRLIACESLRDLADNRVDGDSDGNSGDAALRSYRIDAGNLVDNGHFDCNLDGWSALAPSAEDWTLGVDATGSPLSASSRIDNSAAWPTVGVGTCVATQGASLLELQLRHRLSLVQPEEGVAAGPRFAAGAAVAVACTPYPSTNCTDSSKLGEDAPAVVSRTAPSGPAWVRFDQKVEMPEGFNSLLCTVSGAGDHAPFVLEVDEVRLNVVEWGPTDPAGDEVGGGSWPGN